MYTAVMSPDALTITLFHGSNPDSEFGKRWIRESSEIDEVLSQNSKEQIPEKVPTVIVVKSPEGKLFVYTGNIVARHAKEHGYNVKVTVLISQDDLDIKASSSCWYDIRDFEELLSVLRIYADYPELDKQAKDMPKPLQEYITKKRLRFEDKRVHRAFTTPDDEDYWENGNRQSQHNIFSTWDDDD